MSISRIATEWLSTRALAEIDADGFAQADIDELFSIPPADPVHVGLELLLAARDGAEASRPDIVAMLVVPLPSSEELVLRAPDLAEVASAAWEYRCDVDAREALGKGPSVYFRSWRTWAEAERGWEFQNAFYVRAWAYSFPPGLAERPWSNPRRGHPPSPLRAVIVWGGCPA